MKRRCITRLFSKTALLICLGLLGLGTVYAEDLNIKFILVWATNDEAPPEKHKELSAQLEKKLQSGAPYKWKHYYEMHKTNVVLHPKETRKIEMSKHCLLEATNPNDGRIQVNLYGEGKPVSKHVEPLPAGQIVTLGGNAKNDTGWMILIQRKDDKKDADVKPVPAKTEPVKTEPVKTEPVKTEPVKTEPVK
ncbi:hypothetical protein Cflav_PD3898 [Pedosphaera parvula Ellin514]|uniref:Uncharacterized protein n=1 Tax=Pedosphaera parvula (strain Ellin514) TaxID=320771 RepID=B9XG19_PEDPL|nr:hypothetical protein [Pedosphaera parvula]EEF61181.1 hypothetical protein Cflav_PD3898 [Pedosphaera parvula Ellin514]